MKFTFNGVEFYIDAWLAWQLDTLIYNLKNDWDFVIVITGDRGVRVGKSVLAMTVCAYLCAMMQKRGIKTKYDQDSIYFDNKKLMQEAPTLPPNSIIHYDEGREGLAASKAMMSFQEDLLDFFAECGQLNHMFVVVLPDFFELKETMAVARSEYLINVYRHEERLKDVDMYGDNVPRQVVRFDRGFFEFFNRKLKRDLFDKARSTKRKSYALVKHNFRGRFTNQYPLDEAEYRAKKRAALSRFEKKKEEEKVTKDTLYRDALVRLLSTELKLNGVDTAKKVEELTQLPMAPRTAQKIIQDIRLNCPPLAGTSP